MAALAALSMLASACRSDLTSPPHRAAPDRAALAVFPTPSQSDADAISTIIRGRHMPYGTLADPGFATSDSTSPDYYRIVTYNRTGDGAIWTGHYLAAESFRYAATRSAESLDNVKAGVAGIRSLVDVTRRDAPDLLARSWVPQQSPYLAKIRTDEGHNGLYPTAYRGEAVYWIGNTTRDQYSGAFFGLSVAFEQVPSVRGQVAALVTRMLDRLIADGWNIVMPDGTVSSSFLGRPDQQLALLQIGRQVNPDRYTTLYTTFRATNAATVGLPVQAECQDPHGSYYKFNLDYINFYSLVRLEERSSPFRPLYERAYATLRECTRTHQNAHFNMVDRALAGANDARDADTRLYLGQWLTRPRRAYFSDVSGKYPACGPNRACDPVPVYDRPNTDFLWQRSPFLLWGGGDSTVETAAIDYLLPYWMARHHGVL
jgi:hypothetical protein